MNAGLIWLAWLAGLAGLVLLASALTYRSWRRYARRSRGAPSHALSQDGPKTPLDLLFDAAQAGHTGETGLAGLFDNTAAFAARAHSAQMAGRSLDLMYYIWETDLTGWLLMHDVVGAADRGVRVRLLLDDVTVQGYDLTFLALTQHPNIEVRLFNPIRNRGHIGLRALEFALGLSRFNRRLHCKAWIADGRAAIVGGRNIGDSYFGAARRGPLGKRQRMFRDADMLVTGPLVSEIETLFDSYWNLGLVLPILSLWPKFHYTPKRFRKKLSRRAASVTARAFIDKAARFGDAAKVLTGGLHWTASARVLADPAAKAYGQRPQPWMVDQVGAVVARAQSQLRLITPYFVPGVAGLAMLRAQALRGVDVSLLTNALSASDNVFVHGAYRRYRGPLLAAGARLFEFAPPIGGKGQRDLLHAKVFLIDDTTAIVGSLNFDLRSAYTNSEMGIVFDQTELVAELRSFFEDHAAAPQAYALSLEQGAIRWSVTRPGLPAKMWVEPEAHALWRGLSWVLGRLPIHGWL